MKDEKPIVDYVLVNRKKSSKWDGFKSGWKSFWKWYDGCHIPWKWASLAVVIILFFMWVGGGRLNNWAEKKWDLFSMAHFGKKPISEDERIKNIVLARLEAEKSLQKMWQVINKNPTLDGIKMVNSGTLTTIMPAKTSPEEEEILIKISQWAQKEYSVDCTIFGSCYEDWDGSAIWQDFQGGTDTSLEYLLYFAQEKYKFSKVFSCISNPGNRQFPKPVVRQVNGTLNIEESENRFLGTSWLWKTGGVSYKIKAKNLDLIICGNDISTKTIPGIENQPEDDRTLPEVRAVISSPFKFRKNQKI